MPTKLAFFGATGGCAGASLTAALNAGYQCTALARTPSKLEASLIGREVSESIIRSNLTITSGDVRDLDAVKRVIADADIIVSGIGAYPRFQWSIRKPLLSTDQTICEDAATTILKACQTNTTQFTRSKTILIAISTAGVQEPGKPRALPLAYLPWYGWLLADPLADKVTMEDTILAHMLLPESQRGIGGYVVVKPSILTDGMKEKIDAVRAGASDAPPVGYSIDREMVGQWIFQRLIEDGGASGRWKDTRVTVTY
jgi:nucleoside-diphosphate-sugar epimerase